MRRFLCILALSCFVWLFPVGIVRATELDISLFTISSEGVGESIGSVRAVDTDQGLEIFPSLVGLPPGEHGFHLHANPSCDSALNDQGELVVGLGAGGHWDPDATGQHLGPFGSGHRGDLSRLLVGENGDTPTSVVAPRLRTDDLSDKALVVHAGGDNYSDTPPLGGGGPRIACGVVGSR